MHYYISGVKVEFPFKAYATQVAMMEKIIKSLEKSENCIVENPTGCGKSLSLLCSSLAWQTNKNENLSKNQDIKEGNCNCPCHSYVSSETTPLNESNSLMKCGDDDDIKKQTNNCNKDDDDDDGDDDDDFKEPMRNDDYFKKTTTNSTKQKDTKPVRQLDNFKTLSMESDDDSCDEPLCDDCFCWDKDLMEMLRKKKLPKIYFSSRTHKQLGQVIKELKRTAYNNVKMSILSSRDHTCIHEDVSKKSNKAEKCKELREFHGCKFFDKTKSFKHSLLDRYGMGEAWDIEELVEYGHKVKGCPYFGARELKENADIIFCPYNFLIDPIIRKSMAISLRDSIVILDEAHNIEDVSRDAASCTINSNQLNEAILNFKMILKSLRNERITIINESKIDEYEEMETMCKKLLSLIEDNSKGMEGSFDTSNKVWSGQEMMTQLEMKGLSEQELGDYRYKFEDLLAFEADCKEKKKKRKEKEVLRNSKEITMISSTCSMLESIFMVVNFMFCGQRKYLNDYRIVLTREYTDVTSKSLEEVSPKGVWLSKKGNMKAKHYWNYKLNFWCMNSSIAFLDMSKGVRSVILTSGTLSPLMSFQSELGLKFHTTLESNHVIDLNQVSVQSISSGPNMVSLLGNYQNSEKWIYQDEVGETLLRICQVVPHGVLCFFSSYKALNKLLNRWKTTELFLKIESAKDVYVEPQSSNKQDFNVAMESYYKSVKKASTNGPDEVSGALFLAVCRGKVSEGMDFADNYARAVVLIGIPYPNVKDVQVNLKKSYNDQKAINGLLPGSEWYEVQAFRALNQALGRCIRHKNDWGAILLVDERFARNSKKNHLYFSKWVRQRVQFHGNFDHIITNLQNFMITQTNKFSESSTN